MADDLSDDTVHVPDTAPRETPGAGPCWHCRHGHHHLCVGVGCLPLCVDAAHARKPGVSGLGEVPPLTKGRPEGDATAHKPAHTRGGRT
jgi:hypothetical protein